MNILEKIESLRGTKTPDEIETMLLNGDLGEIYLENTGYQYIKNFALSWLVVEAHRPGFIEWMRKHPNKNVVHHKDENILNNQYSNLRVMTRGDHIRMHMTDPKYEKTEKARREKHSDWFKNPVNAEAEKARHEKISDWHNDPANATASRARSEAISETLIAYNADLNNAKAIENAHKKQSETCREKWINLETLRDFFTVKEYAEASRVHPATACSRLMILLRGNQISCEKRLIGKNRCNVYQRTEQ